MKDFLENFDIGLIFLAVFAAIGLYRILELLAFRIWRREDGRFLEKPCLLILVKDLEDRVEGIVRILASRGVFEKAKAVHFVDLGSRDLTFEILERLSKKYGFDVKKGMKGICRKAPFTVAVNLQNLRLEEAAAYFDRLCHAESRNGSKIP
nr:MAG: hypothetical protein DIU66_00595 [Bacillota bacterium]